MGGYGTERPFSEETAKNIDAEVLAIITASHEQAKHLLNIHRKQLDALAAALLARETLDEHEILEVTGLPSQPPRANTQAASIRKRTKVIPLSHQVEWQ